jgi:hypothetical protein
MIFTSQCYWSACLPTLERGAYMLSAKPDHKPLHHARSERCVSPFYPHPRLTPPMQRNYSNFVSAPLDRGPFLPQCRHQDVRHLYKTLDILQSYNPTFYTYILEWDEDFTCVLLSISCLHSPCLPTVPHTTAPSFSFQRSPEMVPSHRFSSVSG